MPCPQDSAQAQAFAASEHRGITIAQFEGKGDCVTNHGSGWKHYERDIVFMRNHALPIWRGIVLRNSALPSKLPSGLQLEERVASFITTLESLEEWKGVSSIMAYFLFSRETESNFCCSGRYA